MASVLCDCGVQKQTRVDSLQRGASVSCGCKKREHNFRHGHRRMGTQDPTYASWDGAVQRCTNPNHPTWEYYGGRGITIDPDWLVFENFLRDMGQRPPGLTLERKDVNAGYSKSNCIWATQSDQMWNTRRNVRVDHLGRTWTLRELSQQYGVPVALLRQRIHNGWPVERAIST